MNGQFSTTYQLSYDWMARKKNCYVLEYPSKWSDMETFAPIDYRDAYHDYESLLSLSGYDYLDYMEKAIPKKVYDDITFLRRFVSIYFYDSEEYGSLLPGGTVPPETLTVFKVVGDNLVKVIM